MSAPVPISTILCVLCLTAIPVWAQESTEELLQAALYKQQVEGDLHGAIELFAAIAERPGEDRSLAARALLQLGLAYETLGSPEAGTAYRDLLRDYPDQGEPVSEARERLAALNQTPAATPRADDGLVARRIWGDEMAWWLMAGSMSPDGREIAATYWELNRPGNTGDLIVVDAETGELRVVGETDAGSRDGSSADTYVTGFVWSKDGARLAYSEWDFYSDPGFQALHVVNADGSGDRLVSNNRQHADLRPRAWSSDGRWVIALATGWDDVVRIAMISVEDGSTTVLKTLRSGFSNTERRYMTLSLSPDDRYLAYSFAPSPQDDPDVHVLAIDGSWENVVAANGATDQNPLWTPDGSRLVFLSDRAGTADFWAVEMSDGRASAEPFVVHGSVGPVQPIGFTDDGALMYVRNVPQRALSIVDLTEDGPLLDHDEPLTDRFLGSNYGPTWSPDGTRVAFMSMRAGAGLELERYVVVRSLEDGSEQDIEWTPFWLWTNGQTRPQWEADGRSVVLPAPHNERSETGLTMEPAFYRVNLETGHVQREPHHWSSQAMTFYTTGRQEERLRELGIRIDGFRWIIEGIQGGHDALRPGERLLWFRGIPGWVTDFACDDERSYANAVCDNGFLVEPIFAEQTSFTDLRDWRLSPDGGRIAYFLRDPDDPDVRNLWVRSVTMDDEPKLLQAGAGLGGMINWTPDGLSVLFTTEIGGEVAPIYSVDAEGGEADLLPWAITPRQLSAMSFAPDGTRAVLPVGSENPINEIWALSGFPWESDGSN